MSLRLHIALSAALAASAQAAMAFPLVSNHQPAATIVLPGTASPQLKASAATLQSYIQKSTGALLPIKSAPTAGPNLILGNTGHRLNFGDLDSDGFILKALDSKNFIIAGPSDYGTEFGVYEFLERYLGVRWLMPTATGTDIPAHTSVTIPETEVRDHPAYWSREMSPYSASTEGDTSVDGARDAWSRANRYHRRIRMGHNLLQLFPPSKYASTHPEFYPVIGGKRYIPQSDKDYKWEPNFSAPGIVEEAAKNIKEYFRTHPEETSYSLSINDSPNFDESPESLARENGRKNFLGMRDVSDSYFEWANAVVTEVLKEYPDKWFGTLAYFNIAEPPTRVPVHPRIVPFLTYDRMKWADRSLETIGHDVTRRWANTAQVVGWYDYTYGFSYMLPRVYPHETQRYLNWGQQNGVRVHYAEFYPNWGEGPKSWVYMKLLWNPNQNVDALLDQWYQSAVGPAAAPKLKAYYAIWEDFWTGPALKSKWFTPQGEFLHFHRPTYLADVALEDIRKSRQLIDETVQLAASPAQKARAEALRRAWDYYEAAAYAYRAETLAATTPKSETEALSLLDNAYLMPYAQRRLDLLNRSRDKSNPNQPLDFIMQDPVAYKGWQSENWGKNLLMTALPWASKSAPVRTKLEELSRSPEPVIRDQATLVLKITGGQSTCLSQNPGFEAGKTGWGLWVGEGEKGRYELDTHLSSDGTQSLLAIGMKNAAPTQNLPITPGLYYATANVFVPTGQTTSGSFSLAVQCKDAAAKWLPEARFERPAPLTPGQWTRVTIPFELKDESIKTAQLILSIRNFAPDQRLYLDQAGLYRIP